ncbi:NAD(P)H-dependent FMN reductase [Jatrophihabitans sp. GAS493]|uniref:NADPH-dependent FMN reductase n=1 Tax=Jatrophihabitans sp. GAS493 TaxID=1907575 RepID=UPI000BB8F833|nr:NAD(P)H-dependent oxidoreductase [Jatrophihabitans sp. GAS493]SOD73236.1 NAD(P)H-dependent FMN reductase [Jatrophihabitans sp. GAS493]
MANSIDSTESIDSIGNIEDTADPTDSRPLIVGIGGSNRPGSSTDRLLHFALEQAERQGARISLFTGAALGALPIYGTAELPQESDFTDTVARARGIIVATPGYHGGMSGLLKNALDHLEGLRGGDAPYLDGRAVGLIVTAAGWQAGGTTLVSLRSTVHALRGWPTPFAATLNSVEPIFDDAGQPLEQVAQALKIVAGQVMDFARWRAAGR